MVVAIVTLLVVGVLLLGSEIFLPGMVAGLVGFVCLGLGVVFSFEEWGSRVGGFVLLAVLLGLVAGFVAWLRFFPGSRMARPFVSEGTIGDVGAERPELVGREGVALTALRPSGTAVFGGEHVDVVTEGELVERDARVRVVFVEGLRVVVRRL